jgi:arabinofuranan 3-O-arabinosyltransferase
MQTNDEFAVGVERWELARFLTYVLWAAAACVYGYLVLHTASKEGLDFHDIFHGPKSFVHGEPPYPLSSHPRPYFDSGRPYFIFPPAAPLLLAPLGLLSRSAAWVVFTVPMVLLAPAALASIVRRMRPTVSWLPPLVVLLVALFYPYQVGLELGNVDVLCAGLILTGIALLMRRASASWVPILGGVVIGLAIALKPTLWPVALVILAAIPMAPRIGLIAGGLVPTAIGALLVSGLDRYFTYVLPQISEGEPDVYVKREALGDLARHTPLPDTAITVLSLLATVAVTVGVIWLCARSRGSGRPEFVRFAALGLVVPAALLLAPYGFMQYSIYLLVAVPFVVLDARPALALLAGVAIFLVGAQVELGSVGHLGPLTHWRFLIGLALFVVVVAVGLREWLQGRRVVGLGVP